MSKLIILRGYPGSGKTTIGKELEKLGVGLFIDHNAILTYIAGIVGDDDGIYDEINTLEVAMCRKVLSSRQCVIVARGFSNVSSVDSYARIAQELGVEYFVIRLVVDSQEIIKRVQSPERKKDFNPTTDENQAISWMSNNPLEKYNGEIEINNQLPVNEVASQIIQLISSTP